jgi:plasmid stabilization system protein ParE
MKTLILKQALEELKDAIDYYEEQQNGLGLKFKEEIDQCVNWVSQNSKIPMLRAGGYRRINLKIFPYYIAYIIKEDTIWIIAIAHGYRRPKYWIKREI